MLIDSWHMNFNYKAVTEVIVKRGALDELASFIPPEVGLEGKLCVVTDENVARLYLDKAENALKEISAGLHVTVLPPGERTKELRTAEKIWKDWLKADVNRRSTVLSLGGGMICDLAGFCASVYMRGINTVYIPTTLLAQVDAAIGGKTALNLPEAKNMVGTFHQPKKVIIDPDLLASLGNGEWLNGLAEVVKTAAILDEGLFKKLEERPDNALNRDMELVELMVSKCARWKSLIVMKDERESGRRAILNFGHTVGHAIEAVMEYRGWSHGMAVAAGMIVAARLAVILGISSEDTERRLYNLLGALSLPTKVPQLDIDRLIEPIMHDKKRTSKDIIMILVPEIGRAMKTVVEEEALRLAVSQSMA